MLGFPKPLPISDKNETTCVLLEDVCDTHVFMHCRVNDWILNIIQNKAIVI